MRIRTEAEFAATFGDHFRQKIRGARTLPSVQNNRQKVGIPFGASIPVDLLIPLQNLGTISVVIRDEERKINWAIRLNRQMVVMDDGEDYFASYKEDFIPEGEYPERDLPEYVLQLYGIVKSQMRIDWALLQILSKTKKLRPSVTIGKSTSMRRKGFISVKKGGQVKVNYGKLAKFAAALELIVKESGADQDSI